MKGFPNQVADLQKIATGIQALANLVDAGEDARNDGVFGPALVRAQIAGTGHTPRPIEEYIAEQLFKEPSRQSFRTTARGLRELFRLLGLADDSGPRVVVTDLGRRAAAFAGSPMDDAQIWFWRGVIRNMTHTDPRGTSHPYQVLLRLVARAPGITRAKTALALEAADDSPAELDRIVALAALAQDDIREQIGVTKSNWDNAKKVLPKFAEQLKDVIRSGNSFTIADSPGRAGQGGAEAIAPQPARRQGARAPRNSRRVTQETIGRAGTAERSDEVDVPPPDIDPAAAARAIELRADRLRRHNQLVREFAARLAAVGARLFEDPFDILALQADLGILVEVKTLDGAADDERDRVRDALSQLLYYEAFVVPKEAGEALIRRVACFERGISEPHRDWLNAQGIAVIWRDNGNFVGDELASEFLGPHLEEFL